MTFDGSKIVTIEDVDYITLEDHVDLLMQMADELGIKEGFLKEVREKKL